MKQYLERLLMGTFRRALFIGSLPVVFISVIRIIADCNVHFSAAGADRLSKLLLAGLMFYIIFVVTNFSNAMDALSSVPVWQKILGSEQVDAFLTDEEFVPYVYSDNSESGIVKISKSRKWIKVFGRYYPVALIAGYKSFGSQLVMLNGQTAYFQFMMGHPDVKRALAELHPNSDYYEELLTQPRSTGILQENYDKALRACGTDLEKADWEDLRYRFEIEFARVCSSGIDTVSTMHKNVLSEKQLEYAIEQLKKVELKSTSTVLDFKSYENEYCVCNGVAVLEGIGYPANKEGIDFLFKCLGSVDAPYFVHAVKVLKEFDTEELHRKIDYEIKRAFIKRDAVYLAGIIYLAKEIDYDIPFLKEQKENLQASSSESEEELQVAGAQF